MIDAARSALVVGAPSQLRDAIVERLKAAGHSLATAPDRSGLPDCPPAILVQLDAHAVGSPATDVGSEAQAIHELIERASRAMTTARFGRIVVLQAVRQAGSAADTSRLAGTVAVLKETARGLAPVGITLNVVLLHPAGPESTDQVATVAEVAGLVRMLCDEEAGFVTAQCFPMLIAPA